MALLTQDLLTRVRRIEIRTRRPVAELVAGAYHSVFKGSGIEFSEVREYQSGDDAGDIDWHVTARMNAPYVKQYVEEREQRVLFLGDVSASMACGSCGRRKDELATEVAAVLAFSAITNGDRAGLTLFSSAQELHIPARKGRRHGLRLLRELVATERRDRRTDIRTALEACFRATTRRAVVFLISDFADTGYDHALRLLARKHDVTAIRVRDRLEQDLPAAGHVLAEDPETDRQTHLTTGSTRRRQAYAEAAEAQADACRATLQRAGVDLIDLSTGDDYMPALLRYFSRRSRRLRGSGDVAPSPAP